MQLSEIVDESNGLFLGYGDKLWIEDNKLDFDNIMSNDEFESVYDNQFKGE